MRQMHVMALSSALLAIAGCAIAGCGGGGVNIPEGPMPEGGSYTGVWHSPQYGEMHMVQTGSSVVGEYTKDERRGTIQGTVQGNVMRFEWSEAREMVAGRPVTTRGRGYFRYQIEGSGDHIIMGEWGVDNNASGGGEWNAARDRRRQPQLSGDRNSSDEGEVEAFDTAEGGSDSGGDSGGDDDLGDL
jgi:hypothetical protein